MLYVLCTIALSWLDLLTRGHSVCVYYDVIVCPGKIGTTYLRIYQDKQTSIWTPPGEQIKSRTCASHIQNSECKQQAVDSAQKIMKLHGKEK